MQILYYRRAYNSPRNSRGIIDAENDAARVISSVYLINLCVCVCTLRKKFSKNYHTSSKATTDCKNPKNYHTLQ